MKATPLDITKLAVLYRGALVVRESRQVGQLLQGRIGEIIRSVLVEGHIS